MHANLAILLVVPLLASCGAMMVRGPFLVPVDSEPSGATVVYDGKALGVTPCVVAMQRASSAIELRRDGCHPRIVEVGTEPNGWVAGNIATLGLGMLVDLALGTDVNLVDDPVLVNLASTDHPPLAPWVRVGGPIWSPPARERVNEGLHAVGQLLELVLKGVEYKTTLGGLSVPRRSGW